MISNSNITLSPVAIQFLEYMNQHPDAQDTLEDLAEWWSQEQSFASPVDTVRLVLNELADHRLILEHTRGDGRRYYRLNPQKRQIKNRERR